MSKRIFTGLQPRRLGKLIAGLAGAWTAGEEARLRERRGHESAADGTASAAALALGAAAFGAGHRSVTLVAGARSRVKVLGVTGADPRTLERHAQ